MAPIVPYIPETITVHLGAPDAGAENVTISFSDYVKNVLSSEVYPTWEPAALRANALAVISFALNRVYTEYYRSRGYPFDITSSTAIDQKFINGRNIYENISALVDELFTDYLRRQGLCRAAGGKILQRCHHHLRRAQPVGLAGAGAGGRGFRPDPPAVLWRGCADRDERARAGSAGILSRQPRAAGRYRRQRVVSAGRAQPHLAELSGHPEGPGRRHPRRGDGECRPGLPVHFLAGRRRDRGPGDLVRDRDALYGSFEARGSCSRRGRRFTAIRGSIPNRSFPASRARR